MSGPHKKGGETEFFTPELLVRQLGPFDLDPCTSCRRPWDTAKTHYDIQLDGMTRPWFGDVFLNPPYDFRHIAGWLGKGAHHDTIALLFCRTDTRWWTQEIWNKASGIIFLDFRVTFCDQHGKPHPSNCGAPMALISYGQRMNQRLSENQTLGKFLPLNGY